MSVEHKVLAILGSARSNGNTRRFLEEHLAGQQYELIDLNIKSVHQYSYDHESLRGDDSLAIVEIIVASDVIVFATPVYWYAMSGLMKVFVDRLTELLNTSKTLGRALKSKRCLLLSTGTDNELPPGFEVQFELTCKYFDMQYSGDFYLKVI